MSQKKRRILVVDDIPVNCEICREILEDEYEIAIAHDGESALQLADQFEPELILLDVMMDGLDGFAVCRLLRESLHPWVKIIMVSARAQLDDRLEGYEAGADDYVTKPFDEAELLAKVQVHLRLQRAEEIDQIKQNLMEVIRHCSRTPLTPIISNAELIKFDYESLSEQQYKECAEGILSAANRLLCWLESAELLVSLKSESVNMACRPASIAGLLQNIVDQSNEQSAKENGESEVHLELSADGESEINCDPDLLDRMFRSLVSFAQSSFDTNTQSKTSKIVVRVDGGPDSMLSVSIRWEVLPSPEFDLAHLFEPFQSTESALLNRDDCFGLAIAREVVIAHGGTIQLHELDAPFVEFRVEFANLANGKTTEPLQKTHADASLANA